MTVRELIEALQSLPPELRVMLLQANASSDVPGPHSDIELTGAHLCVDMLKNENFIRLV